MAKENKVNNEIGDPSANVLMLVGNATKYLEKLASDNQKSNDEKLKIYVDSIQRERALETVRLNELREVDTLAVATANEKASKQAEVLAKQVSESAEILRGLVAQTAKTIADQLAQIVLTQNTRFAALEKANYENAGKDSTSGKVVAWVAGIVGGITVGGIMLLFNLLAR